MKSAKMLPFLKKGICAALAKIFARNKKIIFSRDKKLPAVN